MASIWKSPNSQNLIARFRGASGKTVNRSTGTPDREEALRTSKGWELEAERERAKAVEQMSGGGIADAVAKAGRLARQGRLDAAAARDLINSLLTASGQESIDATTSKAWCDGWRAGKAGGVKERSKWKYDQVSRDWLEFLGRRAEKPIEGICRGDAIAFRQRLSASGLSARTVNQTVKLLRGIYQEALEQGHLGRNPFAGVDRLIEDAKDDDEGKREPFTGEEVAALIAKADGDWRGIVILCATTGLRLMDAARLQWRALDIDAGLIRKKTAKTGAVVLLPIHPDLEAWLATQTQGIGAAPLFPSLATKGGPGKSGLSMAFKRLMTTAGIESGIARKATGRGRTTSRKSFHSLRHFAVSQMAQAGVRSEVARQITGHADEASHAGYVQADVAALRNAVNLIRLSA
jgi:integrase